MKLETKGKIPNLLSLGRVVSVPVVLLFLMLPIEGTARYAAAAALFILSAVTDTLDGYLARKYNAVTNFGKFIDPVADKLLCVCVMIYIAVDCNLWWVTLGTILTTAREFIISAFRLVASTSGGKVIAAGWMGKLKTVFQDIALSAYIFKFFFAPIFSYRLFAVCFIVSSVLCVLSCMDYIVKNREIILGGAR